MRIYKEGDCLVQSYDTRGKVLFERMESRDQISYGLYTMYREAEDLRDLWAQSEERWQRQSWRLKDVNSC